jgi:hypothetical protein
LILLDEHLLRSRTRLNQEQAVDAEPFGEAASALLRQDGLIAHLLSGLSRGSHQAW